MKRTFCLLLSLLMLVPLLSSCATVSLGGLQILRAPEKGEAEAEPEHENNQLNTKRIFLIGDSTMCEYYLDDKETPQKASDGRDIMGWGHYLPFFFNEHISVFNYASSGESSRLYYYAKKYHESLLPNLGQGDYLFIQFARNENKENRLTHPDIPLESVNADCTDENGNYSYQACLYYYYVLPALERGAIPVLLSPVSPRDSDTGRANTEQMDKYTEAMRDLAEKKKLLFIDSSQALKALYEELVLENGLDGTRYLHAYGDERRISTDNSHLSHVGAYTVAGIISEKIVKAIPEFAPYLLNTPKEYVAE